MATFTVRQGKRYRARIELGWLEALASNELIAGKLRAVGFSHVKVDGSGSTRQAEALWENPDSSGELPPQIAEITEVIDA
jgi:transketolase N-terminal domain/subunit